MKSCTSAMAKILPLPPSSSSQRWAPFMGFDDNAIMDVHLWRHPTSRHPPPREEKPVTPPRTKAKQRERAPLEDPMQLLGGGLNSSTILSAEVRSGEERKTRRGARNEKTRQGARSEATKR